MPLTREFRETVMARVRGDARFREALFTEALAAFLSGEAATGRALLRDLVNATVGFEALSRATGLPAKSLHRMLGPRGNPSGENLFAIVRALQGGAEVRLRVTAASAATGTAAGDRQGGGSDPRPGALTVAR